MTKTKDRSQNVGSFRTSLMGGGVRMAKIWSALLGKSIMFGVAGGDGVGGVEEGWGG